MTAYEQMHGHEVDPPHEVLDPRGLVDYEHDELYPSVRAKTAFLSEARSAKAERWLAEETIISQIALADLYHIAAGKLGALEIDELDTPTNVDTKSQ